MKLPEGFYKNLGPTRFWPLNRPPRNGPIRIATILVFFISPATKLTNQNCDDFGLHIARPEIGFYKNYPKGFTKIKVFGATRFLPLYRPPWN